MNVKKNQKLTNNQANNNKNISQLDISDIKPFNTPEIEIEESFQIASNNIFNQYNDENCNNQSFINFLDDTSQIQNSQLDPKISSFKIQKISRISNKMNDNKKLFTAQLLFQQSSNEQNLLNSQNHQKLFSKNQNKYNFACSSNQLQIYLEKDKSVPIYKKYKIISYSPKNQTNKYFSGLIKLHKIQITKSQKEDSLVSVQDYTIMDQSSVASINQVANFKKEENNIQNSFIQNLDQFFTPCQKINRISNIESISNSYSLFDKQNNSINSNLPSHQKALIIDYIDSDLKNKQKLQQQQQQTQVQQEAEYNLIQTLPDINTKKSETVNTNFSSSNNFMKCKFGKKVRSHIR